MNNTFFKHELTSKDQPSKPKKKPSESQKKSKPNNTKH